MKSDLKTLTSKTGIISEDFNAFYLQNKDIHQEFVYQPSVSSPLPIMHYSENMESYRGKTVRFRPLVDVVADYQPVLYLADDDYVDKPWVWVGNIGVDFSIYYSFEIDDPIPIFVYHSGMAGFPDSSSRVKLGESLADFKSQLMSID